MGVARAYPTGIAVFYAGTIALCIVIDILQYSAPLSFLPQALKDEGHSAPEIAAAIGSYYWAGFLGGACITIYQFRRVVFQPVQVLEWSHLRQHVVCLILGLGGGCIALIVQGLYPTYWVHFGVRLVLGFLGAFLFFFSFLLSIELFEANSWQQTLALTLSSMALHCAEVFGPFVGGSIFMAFGLQTVFFVLAAFSVVNQIMLGIMLCMLPKGDSESKPLVAQELEARDENETGVAGLKNILSSPLMWKSVLVIMPAAMIKAALENILPLFADHKLRYDEFEVGLCFTLVAIAFLTTSSLIGVFWSKLSYGAQTALVSFSMLALAGVSCTMLLSYQYGGPYMYKYKGLVAPQPECWDRECKEHEHSITLFYIGLVFFGMTSAGCFTPAAYFIGDYVDSVRDSAMKDAANAVWNTLWEVGGSLGLALAGIPSTRSWFQEQILLAVLGGVVVVFALLFMTISATAKTELRVAAEKEP